MLLNNLFSNGLGGGSVNERVFDFTATEGQTEFPIPHGGYSVNVSVNGVTLHGPDLNLNDLTKVILLTPRMAGDLIRITLLGGEVAGGGGLEIGQVVDGFFQGDPRFVQANGSRYLASAYPAVAPLIERSALPTVCDPVQLETNLFTGNRDLGSVFVALEPFVDGDVIFAPQQPGPMTGTGQGLLNVSLDAGQTWKPSLLKDTFTTFTTPEASTLGFTTTSNSYVVAMCKRDLPGHYAAVVVATQSPSQGTPHYFVLTDDYGLTWYGWHNTSTSVTTRAAVNYRLFYRNGAYLFFSEQVGNAAKFSTNDGQSWQTIPSATFANAIAAQSFLSDDGILTYANASSLLHYTWPALAAQWTTGAAMTNVAARFATNCTRVKKCGNWWVAWSNVDDELYVSETMTGTYTRTTLPGISQVWDVEEKDGVFYILANTPTGPNLYSAPAGLAVVITALPNSLTPSFTSAVSTNRWPLNSLLFGFNIGLTKKILFKHGREDLVEITSNVGPNNLNSLVSAIPNNQSPHFCKKYGMWFCSMLPPTQAPTNSNINVVQFGVRYLHYRSTDLKTWIPIGTGFSGIIDAGDRLLRLDHLAVLSASTDGINWSGAGITQPSTGVAGNAARIFRHGALVFMFKTDAPSGGGTAELSVSSDGGATWTRATGLSSGVYNSMSLRSPIHFFKGRYFIACPYWSSDPTGFNINSTDGFNINSSADGISWATGASIGITQGSIVPAKVGWIELDGILMLSTGSTTSSNVISALYTDDGKAFFTGVSTNFRSLNLLNGALAIEYDVSNGERYWVMDRTTTLYNRSAQRVSDVYKGSQLLFQIVHPTNTLQSMYVSFAGTPEEFLFATVTTIAKFDPTVKYFIVPVFKADTTERLMSFMRVAN